MISDNIICSVFELLMAVSDPSGSQKAFVTDDTLEGATILMTKIGYLFDRKIKDNATPKKVETGLQFVKIFDKFLEYSETYPTQRIKLIIKNM